MLKRKLINRTITFREEDIEYIEKVMIENDQNRSQVIRALIKNHRELNEVKGGK
jgi:hypothetical protein